VPKPPKIYDGDIPFSDGHQLHFADQSWPRPAAVDWQPNAVFKDSLTFLRFARGRSAAYAEFHRNNGKTVIVFLTDLDTMMPYLTSGNITGKFVFCKRGANYGCKLYTEPV